MLKSFFLFFIISITFSNVVSLNAISGEQIGITMAYQVYEKYPSINIIDARGESKYRIGHIKDAKHLSPYDFKFFEKLDSMDKSQPYFIYCAKGVKSKKVLDYMIERGFECSFSMLDGFKVWEKLGYPVE